MILDPIPNDGKIHTLTACEVGFSETCGRTYDIDVKSCTGFLVYYLKPLDVCNSAYCFGIFISYLVSNIMNTRKYSLFNQIPDIFFFVFLTELDDDCK